MRQIKLSRAARSPLAWALLLAFLVGAILLPGYRYHLNNDGMSYLMMARHYASGDFAAAINTYWSPMYAWLIALLLTIGIDSLTAAKLVTLVSGLVTIPLLWSFRSVLPAKDPAWRTGIVTLSLLVVLWAMDLTTPDLLLCVWFLAFVRLALEPTLRKHPIAGGVCLGVIAGLGYMTKAVSLPFFIALSIVLLLLKRTDDRHWSGTSVMLMSIVVSLLAAAPWIAVISREKGAVTIGENASFIHAALNPLQANHLPMLQGLLPPSGPKALSMWDDPTKIPVKDWHAWDSVVSFMKQIHIAVLNAELFARLVLGPSLLFWVLLGTSILFSFPVNQPASVRSVARVLSVSTLLFLVLYLPFIVEYRYFWAVILLSGVFGIYCLSELDDTLRPSWVARTLAHGLFALSFLALPLWNAALQYGDGERVHAAAESFEQIEDLQGKHLASDNWKLGLQMGYHLGARYFGQPKNRTDGQALNTELLASDMDAYIAFGAAPALRDFREVPIDGLVSPRLFVRSGPPRPR